MADPASLSVAVSVTGLSPDEAMTAFMNLPAGATAAVQVTKPALGPKRYAITAENLSAQGAKDLTTALFLHLERVANSDPES